MAKKSAPPVAEAEEAAPAPPAPATTLPEPPRGYKSKTQRELLSRNSGLGNRDLAELFKKRIRDDGFREERSIERIAQTFGQLKSDVRRRQFQEAHARAALPDPSEPTSTDLKNVQSLAKEYGGVKELATLVSRVADLAEKVGGLDHLRACLHDLLHITGERT
jgi:hypothetical protein